MDGGVDPRLSLPQAFYEQAVQDVARDLLGAFLVSLIGDQATIGTIVETEAYGATEDLASHAAFRRAGVVEAMWGPPGTLYVYRAYGMHPCFNIVTGPEGEPSAVLIRAVSIVKPRSDDRSASGPGRLGRTIGLDIGHNGHPLSTPPFWIQPRKAEPESVATSTRVGVTRGDGRLWRFAWRGHPAVSRPRL